MREIAVYSREGEHRALTDGIVAVFNHFHVEQPCALRKFALLFLRAFTALFILLETASDSNADWTHISPVSLGLPNNRVTSLHQSLNGHVWMGTQGGGLAEFDGSAWIAHPPRTGPVRSITSDSQGRIWTAGETLRLYSGGEWHEYQGTTGTETADKWVVGPPCYNDAAGNSWTTTNPEVFEGVPFLDIPPEQMVVDAEDRLWMLIVEGRSRVLRFDGELLSCWLDEDGLVATGYTAITVDAQERIWITSNSEVKPAIWGGDVSVFNGRQWRQLAPDSPAIQRLSVDKAGTVWAHGAWRGSSGVFQYRQETWRRIWPLTDRVDDVLLSEEAANNTTGLVADNRGGAWIAIRNPTISLVHITADGDETIIPHPERQSILWPTPMLSDRQGQVWIGGGDGVSIFTEPATNVKQRTWGQIKNRP